MDRGLVPLRHLLGLEVVARGHAGHAVLLARFERHPLEHDLGRQVQATTVGHARLHIVEHAGAARYQQRRTGLDEHARRDVVEAAELGLAHTVLTRGVGHLHGAGGDPGGPARHAAQARRFVIALEDLGVVPGQQEGGRASGEQHRTVCGRVEGLEVLHRHLGEFGCDHHIHVARQRHGLKVRVVGDAVELQSVDPGIGHDALDGQQFGHRQLVVGGGLVGALVARDGLADIAFAPVVGS